MKYSIILLLLTCVAAYAGDIRTITVSNAVELAMNNNLQLKQYEKDVKIAEAQYSESFADFWLPGITASTGYTLLDPMTVSNGVAKSPTGYAAVGTASPYTVIPTGLATYSNIFPDNYTAGVTVSKQLFTGFRLWNSLEIKKIALDLARKKYEDKKLEILYSTQTSVYNLAILSENIKLTEELDKQLSNQLRYSVINYDNGLVSEYDKIRVEVLYKNNQPRLLQVRNAYILAKMNVCDSIGLKDYDNIEFLADLMDYTNISMTNNDEVFILQEALSNSIDLISMDYNVKTLELTKHINEATLYPSLSASFNYQYNYKRQFADTDRNWWPSWTAGLQLSWAVDSWIPISRTQNAIKEMNETTLKTDLARQQIYNAVRLQVRSLLLQLEQSKQTIVSQKEGLKQAKLGLRMANDKYMAGTASSIDLSDAEVSYNQAQANYLQAIYDYYSSTLKLKRLIGEEI